MKTNPTLVAKDQPDILSLHIEFLRSCEKKDITVTIIPLKVGAIACTLQLQLSQTNRVCIVALATTTNFDKPLGPSAPTDWTLHPPAPPTPDFTLIDARKPEPNWVTAVQQGELLTFSHRLLIVNPRRGFPVAGVCDAWYRFHGDERMDATYLSLMSDVIPSMADTLMGSGLYNAHTFQAKAAKWAEQNPGIPATMTNSIAGAMQSKTFNITATLNIEFKKRLPAEGLEWIFTRTATKMLEDGRMALDITMCDERMDLVCEAHQLMLVLDAQRKFYKKRESKL